LVAHDKTYQLAKPGFMGRKRGQSGYVKSALYLGGKVQEVVDQYLDSGNTHARERFPDLLQSIEEYRTTHGLSPEEVLVRGDGQQGSVGCLRQISDRHFRFLFGGYTPLTARHIARKLGERLRWELASSDAEGKPRWVCDAGWQVLRSESGETVRVRVLLVKRIVQRKVRKNRHKGKRSEHTLEERELICHLVSNLTEKQATPQMLLDLYDDRATIESHFKDDQHGCFTHHLRTHHFAGTAAFLWLAALAQNLLVWRKHTTFAGTVLEGMGVRQLIHRALQIPARVVREAGRVMVMLPAWNRIVKQLEAGMRQQQEQRVLPLEWGLHTQQAVCT